MENEIKTLKEKIVDLKLRVHQLEQRQKEHRAAIQTISNTQVIINNDIHNRLSLLEKTNNSNEHYFYKKEIDTNTWLVKCSKTGGTFSTYLWRNEKIKRQTCPCCGDSVRSKT